MQEQKHPTTNIYLHEQKKRERKQLQQQINFEDKVFSHLLTLLQPWLCLHMFAGNLKDFLYWGTDKKLWNSLLVLCAVIYVMLKAPGT